MKELLDEISRSHFPRPPNPPAEIDSFEQRMGWRLDPDLRAFYAHCNGARLFRETWPPYDFFPLSKIVRAREAIFGKDSAGLGSDSHYAICDVQDGNYILIDVSRQKNGRYLIIDGYHEVYPDPIYCKVIADSFSDFLAEALRSGGQEFWLR